MKSSLNLDFVKGDELRIKNILEKYGCCKSEMKELMTAISQLEEHCVQYGIAKTDEGCLPKGEREEYAELKRKYYDLEAMYDNNKEVRKKLYEQAYRYKLMYEKERNKRINANKDNNKYGRCSSVHTTV